MKLNACLAYVGYVQMFPSTFSSTHLEYIYNIYANTSILESSTFRTCGGTDGCTEKINDGFNGATSIGSNEFISQKDILFSQ